MGYGMLYFLLIILNQFNEVKQNKLKNIIMLIHIPMPERFII